MPLGPRIVFRRPYPIENRPSKIGNPPSRRSLNLRLSSLVLGLALSLSGCLQPTVQGVVYDINDEPLPGVVVAVDGTPYEALTDALGEYSVPYRVGQVVLNYSKTGYTSGRTVVDVPQGGSFDVPAIHLWRLPPSKGVFFYENNRYRSTRPVEVETFAVADGDPVWGTTKYNPDARTSPRTPDPQPRLLCHNMPLENVRLDLLEKRELTLDATYGNAIIQAWTSKEPLPVALTVIDEPQAVLQQVQFYAPLEPGIYALHWGALAGDTSLDPRLFLFHVDPNATGEEAPAEEAPQPAEDRDDTGAEDIDESFEDPEAPVDDIESYEDELPEEGESYEGEGYFEDAEAGY